MASSLNLLLMGERLRACRNALHMTMKEFSERCGISERYLADIERGHKAPKLDTLVRIVNSAGVSSDYLLQDSLYVKYVKQEEKDHLDDSLLALPPDQQEILCHFIRQLSDSLK